MCVPSPQVLKTNLADLGVVKVGPYLVMFVTSNVGCWIGDYLISTRQVSTAIGRKVVNSLGAPTWVALNCTSTRRCTTEGVSGTYA
jgi:hypothetical protein